MFQKLKNCLDALNTILLGKPAITEVALAALLSKSSILIEDRPGLGKTTLAKGLSKVLGLGFQRIQCTNDLLPMDILGRMDYADNSEPRFIKGPIFSAIVLLDELNRAPARTQSAFLQAMEEGEITVEGQSFELPKPQMFIATQNPWDQAGTSLLPESELDRFSVQLNLGFPDSASEIQILKGEPQRNLKALSVQFTSSELLGIQQKAEAVVVSETILDLVVRFLNFARQNGAALSPRAGRDLIRVSQSLALIRNREFVTPDEIKSAMSPVVRHRFKDADGLIQQFSFRA